MSKECEIIQDLLPLYADGVCSEASREIVDEHLLECPSCREFLKDLRETELESALHREKESVLEYGLRQFRRRSAAVGSAVSGVFLVPILICLGVSLLRGPQLSWVSIVVAALCVLASVTVVPIAVSRDKLFWTFCAFTASLVLLLGVTCLYSRGDWFRIAASAVLFGLSVVFLPFVIRAAPVKKLIGDTNRALIVLGTDFALFFNLLNAIDSQGRFTLGNLLFTLGACLGILGVVAAVWRNRKTKTDREE